MGHWHRSPTGKEDRIAAYDPRVTAAELFPFLATDSPISKEAVRAGLLAITTGRRAELLAIGAGVANIRDYFHWLSDFRVEGDRETGWRVEVHSDSVTDLWWQWRRRTALTARARFRFSTGRWRAPISHCAIG
jgi:hypothetical protein